MRETADSTRSQPPAGDSCALRWFSFSLSSAAVAGYGRALAIEEPASALQALARAVCRGGEVTACAMADAGKRRLAVLARSDAASEAEVAAQARAIDSVCRRLRYVDFAEADRIASALARRLRGRFGDELATWPRAAIPRGGWLVAGLLARHLPAAETGRRSAGAPLLVTDDCALTGVALRRFLHRFGRRRVVFAPLLATAGLARAVERLEPRVEAVIVGEELADRGHEAHGREYESWRRRWRSRLGDEPYWLGISDHVCFRWNEPHRWVWNAHSRTVERGWRVLPPETSGPDAGAARESSRGERLPGPIRPAPGVVWADVAGDVYLGQTGTGDAFRLASAGASLWRALVGGQDYQAMLESMVSGVDVDRRVAARDLDRWLADLTQRGLVEPGPRSPG